MCAETVSTLSEKTELKKSQNSRQKQNFKADFFKTVENGIERERIRHSPRAITQVVALSCIWYDLTFGNSIVTHQRRIGRYV